jgi:hypothetical protein
MSLDDDLREGLARRRAPDGFTGRVMARISAEERRSAQPAFWRSAPLLRRIAAAALLLSLLGGVAMREVNDRRRIAEGEQARRQVMTALHIAGAKVRAAQREVRQIGSAD